LREKRAVSEPEKKAEKPSRIAKNNNSNRKATVIVSQKDNITSEHVNILFFPFGKK
jgi:hypothetical protein